MMAVVETGGKQYQVSPGSIIRIEKLEAKEGDKVILDKVLMLKEDKGEALFGEPLIDKAKVVAEVTKQDKQKNEIRRRPQDKTVETRFCQRHPAEREIPRKPTVKEEINNSDCYD